MGRKKQQQKKPKNPKKTNQKGCSVWPLLQAKHLAPPCPVHSLGQTLWSAHQLQMRTLPQGEGGLPVCPNSWRYTRMGKGWKKLVRKNKYHRSLLLPGGKEPAGLLLPKEQRGGIDSKSPLLNITAWSSSNFLSCTLPWSRNKISFACVSLSNNKLLVFLNTRHTLVLAFGPETWYLLVFTSPVITVLNLLST